MALSITELKAPAGLHVRAIVAEQIVEITDESLQSKPFHENGGLILVNCDVACSLAFGKDPRAVPGIHRMSAGETRQYGVMPGERLAVVGTL